MCDCYSYNGDFGSELPVVLNPNEYFDWDNETKKVPVDACIAEEIKALWEAGIWTRGCCCGHNGKYGNLNVIVAKKENPKRAAEVLEEIDPEREWKVLQWQLVRCN